MAITPAAAELPRLFNFVGGATGAWHVERVDNVAGEALVVPAALDVVAGAMVQAPAGALWVLRGITSNERYVTRDEKALLVAKQQGLGRPASACAALIPIRKSAAWWALAQDDRRQLMEEQSQHIAIGMKYLPAIARRLHHCRDMGSGEPFDFLTWFEYAPADVSAFDDLVAALRASPEWAFVERECDVRLVRAAAEAKAQFPQST